MVTKLIIIRFFGHVEEDPLCVSGCSSLDLSPSRMRELGAFQWSSETHRCSLSETFNFW